MQRTALVTGGAGGIGSAVCRSLAADGCFVYIGYSSSSEKAEALALETGGKAVKLDVTSQDDIDSVSELTGGVDILVNNAGVSEIALFDSISLTNSRRIMEINLIGAMNCARTFIKPMISRKSGCIINISSMWGQVGASCEVDYSASKAGIIGFTKALAKEVAPSGIRVPT